MAARRSLPARCRAAPPSPRCSWPADRSPCAPSVAAARAGAERHRRSRAACARPSSSAWSPRTRGLDGRVRWLGAATRTPSRALSRRRLPARARHHARRGAHPGAAARRLRGDRRDRGDGVAGGRRARPVACCADTARRLGARPRRRRAPGRRRSRATSRPRGSSRSPRPVSACRRARASMISRRPSGSSTPGSAPTTTPAWTSTCTGALAVDSRAPWCARRPRRIR